MNSRNDKQEELIRRLEDIRRQRTTIQTERTETNDNQGMRRNEQAGESTRQNRNKQRRLSSRPRTQTKNARGERQNTPHAPSARQSSQTKNVHNQRRNTPHAPSDRRDPGQHSLETYSIGHHKDAIADSRYIAQTKISDKIKADDLTNQKAKSIKNNANPLLHQLSDKKSLRQAIILNEVLSKPIALRRHSR